VIVVNSALCSPNLFPHPQFTHLITMAPLALASRAQAVTSILDHLQHGLHGQILEEIATTMLSDLLFTARAKGQKWGIDKVKIPQEEQKIWARQIEENDMSLLSTISVPQVIIISGRRGFRRVSVQHLSSSLRVPSSASS
jgi:hypothetical protein